MQDKKANGLVSRHAPVHASPGEKTNGKSGKNGGRISGEFVEEADSDRTALEQGRNGKAVGLSQEDVPLTQADIDFINEFAASDRHNKLLRRVDLRVIPILVLIYLASFLDRGNIGNARIEGLEADLGISAQQYQWCLSVFFFAYATFEIVGAVPLKIFRPSIWLPCCILAWGTVMTLQGIVQGYGGLIATRFFLGMTEASFFPGALFILSQWYLRGELQKRMAYLYSSASVAGAFSGLLAYAIAKMDGVAGLHGWRWIFILEGLATVAVGLAAPFLLQDDIERSKWLNEEEKRYLRGRQTMDRAGRNKGPFRKLYLKQAVTDYKIWITSGVYFSDAIGTYGLSFSLPTITKQLGYTSAQAQLLTVPTYVFAALFTLVCAYYADKTRKRMVFVLIPYGTAIAGLIICLATPQPRFPGLILGAVYLVAAGIYSVVPGIIAWNANNLSGEWKRSMGMGAQIGITNYGGVIGSNIFLADQAPRYPLGYGLALGVLVVSCILAVILHVLLKRENARRDRMTKEEIYAKYTQDELTDMGDKSPLFRYEI